MVFFSNFKSSTNSTKQRHTYHLVDQSPWPLVTSMTVLSLFIGAAMYFHRFEGGLFILLGSLVLTILAVSFWFRDIIREATFEGRHTKAVQRGLRMGMALFIVSEVMFFFAFFWAFFHSCNDPAIELAMQWPPVGIDAFDPLGVPALNTLILLTSGLTITWAHHALLSGDKDSSLLALEHTLILAICFTGFQLYEYCTAPFSISDGVYGSVFYMSTGFHGFHVLVGTIFIFVCSIRLIKSHFTQEHHFGFEAAAWYWHFVDVVWLFLYLVVYWWGNF
jgi:cytochrome c oxidase subunit 3